MYRSTYNPHVSQDSEHSSAQNPSWESISHPPTAHVGPVLSFSGGDKTGCSQAGKPAPSSLCRSGQATVILSIPHHLLRPQALPERVSTTTRRWGDLQGKFWVCGANLKIHSIKIMLLQAAKPVFFVVLGSSRFEDYHQRFGTQGGARSQHIPGSSALYWLCCAWQLQHRRPPLRGYSVRRMLVFLWERRKKDKSSNKVFR